MDFPTFDDAIATTTTNNNNNTNNDKNKKKLSIAKQEAKGDNVGIKIQGGDDEKNKGRKQKIRNKKK